MIGHSVSLDYIKDNIKSLEEILKMNSTMNPLENIAYETLQNSARIFTFLNHYPPNLLFLYGDIFRSSAPKMIIFALSSILKTTQNALKESALKVLTKVMKTLQLNHFDKIKTLTKESTDFHSGQDIDEINLKSLR